MTTNTATNARERRRREREQHAGRGRDALAAAEAGEERPHVSRDRGEARPRARTTRAPPGKRRGERQRRARSHTGSAPLSDVEHERRDPERGTERAIDVGRAEIARAQRAHVDAAEPAARATAPTAASRDR